MTYFKYWYFILNLWQIYLQVLSWKVLWYWRRIQIMKHDNRLNKDWLLCMRESERDYVQCYLCWFLVNYQYWHGHLLFLHKCLFLPIYYYFFYCHIWNCSHIISGEITKSFLCLSFRTVHHSFHAPISSQMYCGTCVLLLYISSSVCTHIRQLRTPCEIWYFLIPFAFMEGSSFSYFIIFQFLLS